jgi:hypothetical protein
LKKRRKRGLARCNSFLIEEEPDVQVQIQLFLASASETPTSFVLVTPYAESLKVIRTIRSAAAKRLHMMHVQSNIRTSRYEWLPPIPPWESPRSSASNTSVVVPAEDLTAELLPFLALSAASSIECVMPSPILALPLLLSQPILDCFDELRNRVHCCSLPYRPANSCERA